MPVFLYKAYDRAGKLTSGQINGSGRLEVVEALKNKNLFPISVAQESQSEKFQLFSLFSTIDQKVILAFTRQLAVLLKSGISLPEAINLILEQEQSAFSKVLFEVRDSLKEGKAFADALENHKSIFNRIYVQLVRAGEASGNLDKVLAESAQELEQAMELQKQISGAFRGPMMIIAVFCIVFVGVVTLVIPKIAGMISEMGGQIPWITSFLLSMADFITTNLAAVLVITIISIVSIIQIFKTKKVLAFTDKLMTKMPVLSTYYKTVAVVQFCQTLGMLLNAGVNLPQALDIVCQTIESNTIKKTFLDAKENIVKEGKIAKYLEQTRIFPSIAFYMIKMGEESGELPQMLLRVAKDYQLELTDKRQKLVQAINPIMYVFIAFLLGILVYAIFGPLTQLSSLTVV